jgi:hypothetical protein
MSKKNLIIFWDAEFKKFISHVIGIHRQNLRREFYKSKEKKKFKNAHFSNENNQIQCKTKGERRT